MLFIFEGINGAGKTTIAKMTSEITGIPYYNCFDSNFKVVSLQSENLGVDESYTDFVLLDFALETGIDLIMDRSYPSGWVYTRALKQKLYPGFDENAASAWAEHAMVNTLIFWLRCNPKMAEARSKDFSFEFLERINENYKEYFNKFDRLQVLSMNNGVNFVNPSWPEFYARIYSKIISAFIKEKKNDL